MGGAYTAPAAATSGDDIDDELVPDAEQIARFVRRVFKYATAGGVVSLRAYTEGDETVFANQPVALNGDLGPLIKTALAIATKAARAPKPIVFCPPLCTFTGAKASEDALCEGLVLSVECDAYPTRAREVLTALLGPPSFVVASGGVWMNPDTGECEPKIHLHWLLSEPTTTPDEHQKLKRARTLACDLVGGDATAKTPVHCFRWPGTLHKKAATRLARIIEENNTEIDLNTAHDELEGVTAARGNGADHGHHHGDDQQQDGEYHHDTVLDAVGLLGCAERIANTDTTPWDTWNITGLAFWRASGGRESGFAAFDLFSKKASKYDSSTTRGR
jgi:hypothetical protein